jgi:hypothetical protein
LSLQSKSNNLTFEDYQKKSSSKSLLPRRYLEGMQPEPWLRGPIHGIPVILMPVFFSFQQAREDVDFHLSALTPQQIWATPYDLGSAGFHVRHAGRSADRLATYLAGRQLSPSQLAALDTEKDPGASREDLLEELAAHFGNVEAVIREIDPASLAEPRTVGRRHMPTSVAGLLTHIAEHTQRHVGQAISAAKLIRAMSAAERP